MITKKQAHTLLSEAEEMNPGKWVTHSENVAITAERIASECSLNTEKAYTMGLLHDIGRRFGKYYIRHGLDGYNFLRQKGFYEHAQICLTHSYTDQDINVYEGVGDYTEEERKQVESLLDSIEYNDYDRLIHVCDFLGIAEGICSIETRICDVIKRVGTISDNFMSNIFKKFELKQYFEKKYQIDIYAIITNNHKEVMQHI